MVHGRKSCSPPLQIQIPGLISQRTKAPKQNDLKNLPKRFSRFANKHTSKNFGSQTNQVALSKLIGRLLPLLQPPLLTLKWNNGALAKAGIDKATTKAASDLEWSS